MTMAFPFGSTPALPIAHAIRACPPWIKAPVGEFALRSCNCGLTESERLQSSLTSARQVAARFTAVRIIPSADELQRLATEADFSAVAVSVAGLNIHLPRIDKLVLDHLSATPIAAVIDATDEDTRRKIGASVMKQLQRYADGDGITYPEETCLLTARARVVHKGLRREGLLLAPCRPHRTSASSFR